LFKRLRDKEPNRTTSNAAGLAVLESIYTISLNTQAIWLLFVGLMGGFACFECHAQRFSPRDS
jgi:hypothetical protein